MTSRISLTMSPVHWLALFGLSVLWGGSFLFVEVGLESLPVLSLVALRVGLAALVLHVLLAAQGVSMALPLKTWGSFAVMALLNNVLPFAALVWAQLTLTAGLASILNASTPLFALLVAHSVTQDEPLSRARMLGVCIGMVGVAVLVGPQMVAPAGGAGLAMLACLGAALSYACAGVFGRRFAPMGLDPVVVAAGQLTMSTCLLAPIALLLERPFSLPPPALEAAAAVIALAVFSTAAAYVIYFRLLAAVGAGNLLFVTQLVPVSALLLGASILGETIVLAEVAAMLLIAVGLAMTDPRLVGRVKRSFDTRRVL